MSKSGTSPTHAWLIGNSFLRFFGWCFLVLLAIMIVALAWLRVSLHEHCPAPFKQHLDVTGYALQVEIREPAARCVQQHD